MTGINFHNTCRVCMLGEKDMVDMSTSHCEEDEISFVQVITYVLGRECLQDVFKKLICLDCIKEGETAYNFKVKCERSLDSISKRMEMEMQWVEGPFTNQAPELDIKVEPVEIKEEPADTSDNYENTDTTAELKALDMNNTYRYMDTAAELKTPDTSYNYKSIDTAAELKNLNMSYNCRVTDTAAELKTEDEDAKPFVNEVKDDFLQRARERQMSLHDSSNNTVVAVTVKDLKPGQTICPICTKTYKNFSLLKWHMKIHDKQNSQGSTESKFTSAHCRSVPLGPSKRFEPPSFICYICCKISFPNKNDLIEHMKVHMQKVKIIKLNTKHADEIEKSALQNQGNVKKQDLNKNQKRPISRNNKCKMVFVDIKPKLFICKYCKKTMDNKKLLDVHEKWHTTTLRKIKYVSSEKKKCPLCEKYFTNSTGLIWHMKMHVKVNTCLCKICDYMCGSPENRLKHEESHRCKVCNKIFLRPEYVKTHEQTHIAASFSCDMCKVKCKTRQLLQLHVREHIV